MWHAILYEHTKHTHIAFCYASSALQCIKWSAAVAAAAAAAGTPAQRWARDSNNALRSTNGKCLEVPGGQFQQGAQMQVGLEFYLFFVLCLTGLNTACVD
jgi:uncharacterized FlgJ-related protein